MNNPINNLTNNPTNSPINNPNNNNLTNNPTGLGSSTVLVLNWYLYLSTYLSVLDVLEYLVYGNVKVLVLVLVLDQKVLGTYK